ncbi:hypothetical protein G9A89_010118 [Geosiphon pyriformis]|nr:hypothetical protein G9A89_010118 [Geosiphon pyriformis]
MKSSSLNPPIVPLLHTILTLQNGFLLSLLIIFFLYTATTSISATSFLDPLNNYSEKNTTEPLLDKVEIANLTLFAQYSSVAYCNDTAVLNWECGVECQKLNTTKVHLLVNVKDTDTQAYVATNSEKKLIIIVFRGTTLVAIKDSITNNQISFKRYPFAKGAKVHRGFYVAFKSAKDLIFDKVQNLTKENPEYSVTLSGHSLGGALALLESLDLKQRIPTLKVNENFFVYTYGQPRVGNKIFASYVDRTIKLLRMTHTSDMIPHLPLRVLGYQHPSGELWIKHDKTAKTGGTLICKGVENPNCSNSIQNFKFGIKPMHNGPYFGIKVPTYC